MRPFVPDPIAEPGTNPHRSPFVRLHQNELIVDNFAGGGGASVGIEWALGRSPDIAINHDPQAVAMHQANHPKTKHFVEDVWDVDPIKACGGKPVALAWFSPDCKHFSKAKGGKPVSKKIRSLAWIVVKWAKAHKAKGKPIRVICLENVEEFQTWGPLGDDDRPDKLKKGLTFRRWKASLEALGYKVEFRELIAADYGAPTTRKRLFLVARCDGLPIRWPEKTHDQHGRYGLPKWRAAAECIDWSLACPSIFLTTDEARVLKIKRPLAENTLRRIARGLQKFVIDNPTPFIVGVGGRMGQSPERPVDRPMQTITAKGDSALAVPFVAKFRGDSAGSSAEVPLPTITAGPAENPAGAAHAMALVSPTLQPALPPIEVGNQVVPLMLRENPHLADHPAFAAYVVRPAHGERDASGKKRGRGEHEAGAPLPTQTGSNEFAVVSAGIVPLTHQGGDRNESTDEPMKTITGAHRGEKALAVAHIVVNTSGHPGAKADDPLPTITTGNQQAVSAAYVTRIGQTGSNGDHVRSVEDPVSAVLVGAGGPEYSGKPVAVDKPLGALTAENHRAIAAATLITTGYGERPGQAPRVPGLDKPLGTIVNGQKHAAVMAFMAQHNTGEVGHPMERPVSTIVGKGCTQALVSSFGVKLKGTCKDGQQLDLPLATINAEGTHHARADAFLVAYYGNDKDGQGVQEPMRTLTARDRLGLVRVDGDLYQIVDIGMRMLVPPELYMAQGFPASYKINIEYKGKPLPKDAQVRMCGNSVSPFPCAALVRANFIEQAAEAAA